MKARRKTNVRAVSRHFLGGSFLWALWLKKNLSAKMLWRERAAAEEFLRF